MHIGQDLNLDVTRPGDVTLEEHGSVAEGALGLPPGLLQPAQELVTAAHDPHTPAAAPEGRLYDQGISHRLGHLQDPVRVIGHQAGAGNGRNSGLPCQPARRRLVAERLEQFGRRPDEGDTGIGAGPREPAVLRKESVTGVDGVYPAFPGQSDDAVHVQVGSHRSLVATDLVGFVCLEPVQAEAVFVGVDRRGAKAQLGRRPHDSNGDLAPVGRHDFLHRFRQEDYQAGRDRTRSRVHERGPH